MFDSLRLPLSGGAFRSLSEHFDAPPEYLKKGIDKRRGTEYNLAVLLTGQAFVRSRSKTAAEGSAPSAPAMILTESFLWNGAVVQLVRTPACHAGGRGFKSLPRRHFMRCYSSVGRAHPW